MTSTMRFDSWENSQGTVAAQIDSTGRISQPVKPIISGRMGSIATISGAQKIPFDQFWVQRGITYDSGTRRFTIPKTGIYRIDMSVFTYPTAGTRTMIGINQDAPDTSSNYGHAYGGDAQHQTMSMHSVVSLTAGDYLVFYLSAGSLYNGSGDRFNQFSIEMIA